MCPHITVASCNCPSIISAAGLLLAQLTTRVQVVFHLVVFQTCWQAGSEACSFISSHRWPHVFWMKMWTGSWWAGKVHLFWNKRFCFFKNKSTLYLLIPWNITVRLRLEYWTKSAVVILQASWLWFTDAGGCNFSDKAHHSNSYLRCKQSEKTFVQIKSFWMAVF